ncbi:MAG: ATPase [Micromonosporaceae bacterium]|nr:ATPase [Micromonosporaceae bacterium]
MTVGARLGLLALATASALVATRDVRLLAWIGLLAAAGGFGLALPRHRVVGPLSRLAEVIVVCFAVDSVAIRSVAVGDRDGAAAAAAFLPYLLAPVLSAAVYRRTRESLALLGVATGTLVGLAAARHYLTDTDFLVPTVQWLLLAAASAGVVAWVQATLTRQEPPQPYAEATRLLTQLRTVARQLPGATLDPGGIAEHLLDEVRTATGADRAAVLSASGGSRLVVLAQTSGSTDPGHSGLGQAGLGEAGLSQAGLGQAGLGQAGYAAGERIDWETSLDSDSAIADAWASQQIQVAGRSQARSHPGGEVSALVVPLVAGVRTVGLLAVEADTAGAYPPGVVARVAALAAPTALRLEAALLFDEVRSLATNEERQRLAREIHDGVAQELVMVGYGIDNTLAVLPADAVAAFEELRTLRSEVTRVITELRLSLFELRSEVDRQGGLAAAIAEYARAVGASAGLRVHLSIDESTARLPAATEAELLRIAQEAITNARKHAGAQNLWVTCAVDPPFAQVEVSDDGHGIARQRPEGRYGLAIMRERAERIRGRLEIQPREPSGTTVAVVLGSSHRRGTSG